MFLRKFQGSVVTLDSVEQQQGPPPPEFFCKIEIKLLNPCFNQMRNLRRRIHLVKSPASPNRWRLEAETQTLRRQRRDPHQRHQKFTTESTTGLPTCNNHRHYQGTALYHKVTQTDITVYNTVTTGRCRSLRFSSLLHYCCVCACAPAHMTQVFLFTASL